MNDHLLSDAHIHLNDEAAAFLAGHEVLTVISTASADEYRRAKALAEGRPHIAISCGIHPWQAEAGADDAFAAAIQDAAIIGEIGLDNVWCTSDLACQRDHFGRQLAYASAAAKPVVLHLKGMEQEALATIRRYPNTYHVHWYSCPDHLDGFLDLGCYMSVGPFPSLDPAVAAVASRTPLDRLLIETDGADAVRWATGRAAIDYPATLVQIATEIADLRGLSCEEVLRLCRDNLRHFLGRA